ncbi:MAG: ribonuclease Z [Melioribacteraceae bacterium]|nr:ribonuclease Z [Melioribacteraceae bacterium]
MSKKKYSQKYPLVWQKDDFYIEIFCSIPNIATGILLSTDEHKFVIDPGDGILRDLNKNISKEEILDISDIFISHGHHDHVGGVWSFLTYMSVLRRQKPLSIYFPKGCREILSIHNAFLEVYSDELTYKINLIGIEKQRKINKGSLIIEPFKVNHNEMNEDGSSEYVPSLGYKFNYNQKSICYGGDTAYCENLVKMSKDSDLAIIEAGAIDENDETHLTMQQAEEIGKTAKEYFLVHVPD